LYGFALFGVYLTVDSDFLNSMSNSISFVCWKDDEKLEIQLEPEALVFEVLPGNEITFEATSLPDKDFKWDLRIEHKSQSIQLMPGEGLIEIEIFENGILLEDWYKYM
jgi:hypothetical protein